ncbi:MAG: GTP 3',8-cyclase MoaA [Clostridiales bacterium]|nr:MAG: GTP 3',8-cyclase MoaA [Clostridiales bacterium]
MRDLYGRNITYLRLSVTDLCNLRCRYCMPETGVCKKNHSDMLTEDEMIDVVKAAASLGIKKIRITGGEPLVKPNILSICERAASVNGIEELCITTNGILLPKMAKQLRDAGVNRVNISIDTLDDKKYRYITRFGDLSTALKGLETAVDVGFDYVKINTVLIGGFNDDEIDDFVKLTLHNTLDVRFIELMPMYSGGYFDEYSFISADIVLNMYKNKLIPCDSGSGVAGIYKIQDAKGRIGLIRQDVNHICAKCNRIRVTADGKIKPCLHSPQEISLKGLNQEQMKEKIALGIKKKPRQHKDMNFKIISGAGRYMNQIGG